MVVPIERLQIFVETKPQSYIYLHIENVNLLIPWEVQIYTQIPRGQGVSKDHSDFELGNLQSFALTSKGWKGDIKAIMKPQPPKKM